MLVPLNLLKEGEAVEVKKIALKDDLKKRIRELGLVAGKSIVIIKNDGKSLILGIDKSRFAIDLSLARKIFA